MKKLLLIFLVLSSSLLAFSQGLWTQKASLPATARGYGIGFSIGNYGYAGLGYNLNSNAEFHDFWQYNPANNTWIQKANFPGLGVTSASVFVIGNNAYVVSGSNNPYVDTCYRECWKYNSVTNTWIQRGSFPGIARGCAIGFAIGSKGYYGTGYDSAGNYYNDFWQYDTTLNQWKQLGNFGGTARYGACGFAIDGKGYICFGADKVVGTNVDIWAYDTMTDSWTKKSNCPGDSIFFASGFMINNNIYIGTGQDGLGYNYRYFWQYDVLTDTWKKQPDFIGSARVVCSAFAIADTGYLGLGYNDTSTFYNDWYKFYPDTITEVQQIKNVSQIMNAYPNPFQKKCTIEIFVKGPVFFSLFNMIGEKVNMNIEKTGTFTYILQKGNLSSGTYILSVQTLNSIINQKLIIN